MREEITEPQHWRTGSQRGASRNASWSSRRRSQEQVELPAEAVDAAFAEDVPVVPADTSDIISNLSSQLDLLEKQRQHLQWLLEQAQG